MERVANIVTGIAGLLLLLALGGFGITSVRKMPEHVQIYVDDARRVYLAPPCVTERAHFRLVTVRQAYDLKYKPEDRCRETGGFTSHGRSLTGTFLQKIGVLRPLPERWKADGTWNW